MALTKKWFDLKANQTDLENVLGFVGQLPSNLREIFDSNTSNFQQHFLENDREFGIKKLD